MQSKFHVYLLYRAHTYLVAHAEWPVIIYLQLSAHSMTSWTLQSTHSVVLRVQGLVKTWFLDDLVQIFVVIFWIHYIHVEVNSYNLLVHKLYYSAVQWQVSSQVECPHKQEVSQSGLSSASYDSEHDIESVEHQVAVQQWSYTLHTLQLLWPLLNLLCSELSWNVNNQYRRGKLSSLMRCESHLSCCIGTLQLYYTTRLGAHRKVD